MVSSICIVSVRSILPSSAELWDGRFICIRGVLYSPPYLALQCDCTKFPWTEEDHRPPLGRAAGVLSLDQGSCGWNRVVGQAGTETRAETIDGSERLIDSNSNWDEEKAFLSA